MNEQLRDVAAVLFTSGLSYVGDRLIPKFGAGNFVTDAIIRMRILSAYTGSEQITGIIFVSKNKILVSDELKQKAETAYPEDGGLMPPSHMDLGRIAETGCGSARVALGKMRDIVSGVHGRLAQMNHT